MTYYNIRSKSLQYTNIWTEISQTYYYLAFPVTFTQETLQNMYYKLNLCQNTISLV